MKNLAALLIASMLLCHFIAGCGPDTSAYTNVKMGPIQVGLVFDSAGHVTVTGGVFTEFSVSLGFVQLEAGIQNTLNLTKNEPFHLYILWQDDQGQVMRTGYQIGQEFNVKFAQNESVKEIRGENDCVIIVVERRNLTTGQSSAAAAQPDNTSGSSGASADYAAAAPQTANQGSACYPTFPARLHVGKQARVIVYQITVRSDPGKYASKVNYLARNRVVDVLDGPVCVDNQAWWRVYSSELGYGGWVLEADDENYYLQPE